jgi:hypothetical protein
MHVKLVVLLGGQRGGAQLAQHQRSLLQRLAKVVVVLWGWSGEEVRADERACDVVTRTSQGKET